MNNQPAQHLEEVPFGSFQLELDLADDVYDYSEKVGYLRCYAAYVDGNYAGYMIIMASEMMHHVGTIQAVTDAFYIAPEYRSSGAFKALLNYVEADLKSNGIRFLTLGVSVNTPRYNVVVNLLTRKGYALAELLVTKELK